MLTSKYNGLFSLKVPILVNVTVIRFGDDVRTVTGIVVSNVVLLTPRTVGLDVGFDDG